MPEQDPKMVYAGIRALTGGMDSGRDAALIRPDQVSNAVNATTRGGFIRPRPGFAKLTMALPELHANGRFQHAAYYRPDVGPEAMILVASGRFFYITPGARTSAVTEITIPGDANPNNRFAGWSAQGENFWVFQDAQSPVFIFDGASSRRSTAQEIKTGSVIVSGMGRFWYAAPNGLSFRATDLVRGPSGTPLYNYRDAMLKEDENTFLNTAGDFSIPSSSGPITAMRFPAVLDTSLGQGPLQVGTPNTIFSVNAPVDRDTWKDLKYPIQTESLIDYGPRSQQATIPVNGDLMYRSIDGIRSFILARREFQNWGNKPKSFEMNAVLAFDQSQLLGYSSAVSFDNRFLITVSPVFSDQGIYHRGLIALNFDGISAMFEESPPAYDGVWTGVKIFQVIKGEFSGVERSFAFVLGKSSTIELWEITKTAKFDEPDIVTDTRIEWSFEMPKFDFSGVTANRSETQKRLQKGVASAKDIVGPVDFNLKYRPDDYPCFTPWYEWSVCANYRDCVTVPGCKTPKTYRGQYRPRMGIQQPPEACTPQGRRMNVFFQMQPRLEVTGHAIIEKMRFAALETDQNPHDPCVAEEECSGLECCGINPFSYQSDPLAPYS